jgi:hypothetical protein
MSTTKNTNRKKRKLLILLVRIAIIAPMAFIVCEKTYNNSNEIIRTDKIDPKLVGKWRYMLNYYYYFNNDGNFNYISSSGLSYSSMYKGKYTASNGKVSITDIIYINSADLKLKNQNLEYSFGTDEQGEYLLIPQYEAIAVKMDYVSTYKPVKFRKSN